MDLTPEERRARRKAKALENAKRPNRAKYVTTTQCTAVFRSTGEQCRGHAVKGRSTCKKHGGLTPLGGTVSESSLAGTAAYWKRIREAAEKDPGLMSQLCDPHHSQDYLVKLAASGRAARARKLAGLAPLPKKERPSQEEKVVLRADKIVTEELRTLPAVPDRPFDQLEPHEQLVVVTGQALVAVHETLSMDVKNEDGTINLKAASLRKDTALRTLSIRVKVDQNALMAKRQDKMTDLLQRIREEQEKAGDSARVIDVKAG